MVKCNKKVLKCLRKGKGIQVKFSLKQHGLRRFVMAFPIRKVGLCFHCFTLFSWAPLCPAHGISKSLQAATLQFVLFENSIFLYVLKRRFIAPRQNFSPTNSFIKYTCQESEGYKDASSGKHKSLEKQAGNFQKHVNPAFQNNNDYQKLISKNFEG